MIHHFVGNVNVLYFGAKGVETGGQPPYPDDYPYLQNALNYCAGKGKCMSLPGRKFYTSKTLSIPHNSIGGGIVSEQGSNSYVKSCIELMASSTDLYTIRNYSQGTTLKDIAIRGRSVSIASSVAVLFKRVDEYPNSGDPWKDDLENNIDAVIEGCDFGNAETHLEFWGRQVTIKHNTFSGGHNAMLFKQFNTLGKYGGSARGYRIWNNFFHSFDSGNANRENFALINNKTTDGYGFDIVGNFSDSFNTFFMGNLVNSLVSGNLDYTLLGYFIKAGNIINSNITSNNVDHAQRYSDTGTNPPYNSKGAVHADRIDKTIISNNNFTTSSGSSILSEGVTNSKIQGNIFNRWGVATAAPVACIVLDSSANTGSKSYGNEIDGNTFYNSLKVGGYLLESGTFDTNNFWGNGNRIRLESQATLTALFNTPNFKLSQSVSFRRNLIAGENIGDANQDTFSISGLYNITNDTIAASIIGLPIGAAVAGTLKVEVANLYATRYYMPFRSSGNENIYIQKISNNIAGEWLTLITSKNEAQVDALGVVKQSGAVVDVVSQNATDLATALTLVNELKKQFNLKLASDRGSGQQA